MRENSGDEPRAGGRPAAGEPEAPSASRRATTSNGARAVVAPILVLQILLWVAVFGISGLFRDGPNGKSMGTDFAVFSGAASALSHGQNPYDYRELYRAEKRLLGSQHIPVTTNEFNVRAGNPPLFYWALEPLTRLPFRTVAWLWILGMYLCAFAGFALTLRYLQWTRWQVPALVFLLMPAVVTGALYGNVHGPVFALLGLCLVLLRRHPAFAGAVGSLGWLKPQLALPLVFVIFVFHCERRRSMAAGFGALTAALLALTVMTTGLRSLTEWLAGLNSWSKGISKEPNIASLSGLYVGWAPRPAQLLIAGALVGAALLVTGLAAWSLRPVTAIPMRSVAWIWILWFLVSPFTHYPDVIVLTAPVLALFGPDGERVSTPLGAGMLYLCLLSLVLFPTPLVSLAVVALAVLAAVGRREPAPASP